MMAASTEKGGESVMV